MENHDTYERKLTFLNTFIKDIFYHVIGLGLVGVGFLIWGFYEGFSAEHLSMSVTFLSLFAGLLFLVFLGTVIKVRHSKRHSGQWSRKFAKWLLGEEEKQNPDIR